MKEIGDLIKHRLKRADETLGDAKILFDNSKLFSAVNRIYYAMFYAVNGLLLTKGLSSSKHSGVLALFNKEFINKGIVEKDIGRFYNEIFEFRQKGDYKDFVKFEEKDVEKWLNEATKFIPQIAALAKTCLKVSNAK